MLRTVPNRGELAMDVQIASIDSKVDFCSISSGNSMSNSSSSASISQFTLSCDVIPAWNKSSYTWSGRRSTGSRAWSANVAADPPRRGAGVRHRILPFISGANLESAGVSRREGSPRRARVRAARAATRKGEHHRADAPSWVMLSGQRSEARASASRPRRQSAECHGGCTNLGAARPPWRATQAGWAWTVQNLDGGLLGRQAGRQRLSEGPWGVLAAGRARGR